MEEQCLPHYGLPFWREMHHINNVMGDPLTGDTQYTLMTKTGVG